MTASPFSGVGEAERAPTDDRRCFACGPENEAGLRLVFRAAPDEGVCADVELADVFQGWRGVAHGGIVMMLLDEAMAHAGAAAGESCVTAGIRVRFRKPVPLGAMLRVTGKIKWRKRSLLSMEAAIFDRDGVTLATGEGEFLSRGPFDAGVLAARSPMNSETPA